MEAAAREEILLRSKMFVEFPLSQARLTRAQHAALASLLARWDILFRPEPRSADEEEAVLLLAHLRHAIDGFIRIDLEDNPYLAAESWQWRLDWLKEQRRTALHRGNPGAAHGARETQPLAIGLCGSPRRVVERAQAGTHRAVVVSRPDGAGGAGAAGAGKVRLREKAARLLPATRTSPLPHRR